MNDSKSRADDSTLVPDGLLVQSQSIQHHLLMKQKLSGRVIIAPSPTCRSLLCVCGAWIAVGNSVHTYASGISAV